MKRKRENKEENNKIKIRKFTPNKNEALKFIYKNNKEEYNLYKSKTFTKEQIKFLNNRVEINDNLNIILIKLLKSYILNIISESKIQKKKIGTIVKNKIKKGDFLLKP